jgi:hypothetical protein
MPARAAYDSEYDRHTVGWDAQLSDVARRMRCATCGCQKSAACGRCQEDIKVTRTCVIRSRESVGVRFTVLFSRDGPQQSMKQRIFISHIHEEHALGAVIAEWITEAFAGHPIQPFLSSDDKAIVAGKKWLDVVEHELDGTAVMISLLSPVSLARPWVNIELGAAWIKHIPIIPLCHSGLSATHLPRPFGDFQAIGLDQNNAATRLMEGVSVHLKIPHSRKLPFADLLKEMRAASSKGGALQAVSQAIEAMPSADDLPDEQIQILQALAEIGNNRGEEEYIDGGEASILCELKPMVFKHHAEQLSEAGLIHIGYWGDGRHYKVTGDGAGWLLARNLMPD